ncbi:peptide deformylase [Spiroplasma endosymbiont of Asaphidion curtum]|uniref:peptide deformylase n=1 Tax=Spiroplasma endosymbiont of Asaphidion curtum TaxID=3066281 RepID=UPI00313C3EBD
MYQDNNPSNEWLVKDNNIKLREKCQPILFPISKDDELVMQKLIDFVITSQNEVLNSSLKLIPAVGLAAPQIGSNKQMYYIHIEQINKNNKKTIIQHALINSKITAHSEQIISLKSGEGCLSVDNQHEGFVPRYFKVIVTGYDYLKKKNVTITARGYEAIVFQHEQKHLEGILYYDLIDKNEPWKKNDNWLYL